MEMNNYLQWKIDRRTAEWPIVSQCRLLSMNSSKMEVARRDAGFEGVNEKDKEREREGGRED